MPIPHQRPGPSSLATKNRSHCTNRLRLSALTTESTDGAALHQLQDLIQNQVGKRRIQCKWGISRLRISQKMLNDSKEPEILGQRSGQQKGSVGRTASLPQIENYLHQRYLELRAQETKVKRA